MEAPRPQTAPYHRPVREAQPGYDWERMQWGDRMDRPPRTVDTAAQRKRRRKRRAQKRDQRAQTAAPRRAQTATPQRAQTVAPQRPQTPAPPRPRAASPDAQRRSAQAAVVPQREPVQRQPVPRQPAPRQVAPRSAGPVPAGERDYRPGGAANEARFAPPMPPAVPPRGQPSVPLSADIDIAASLTPMQGEAVVRANPGSVLGAVRSADVDARIMSPNGGRLSVVNIEPGTVLPTSLHVRNGVLESARIDVVNARGEPSHLSGMVDIAGADLTADRRIVPRISSGFARFFASLTGLDNQTSAVFSGQSRVPVEPHEFFRALGVTSELPLLGPAPAGAPRAEAALEAARRAVDLKGSPVSATVSLAASPRMVSFGTGLQMQLAEGSQATFTRAGGLDRYEITANVTRARFGADGGPTFETGPTSMRLVAQEAVIDGQRRWTVNLLDASSMQGAKLRVPVAGGRTDELDLGTMTLANSGKPLIAIENGRMKIGFDTTLDQVSGSLQLRDRKQREGVIQLGNPQNPRERMRVAARIDLETNAANPLQVGKLNVTADTQGLNLSLASRGGVQLAGGEGFSFGIGNGTALRGSGRVTYTRNGDDSNFTLESRDGVQADVALHGTTLDRSLGEIGIRANLHDGALLRARVRSVNWETKALDMSTEIDARVDSASVTLPSGEQAAVSNAHAVADAVVTYRPGDAAPVMRGNLKLEVSADGNTSPRPGLSFLPRGVPGFNRGDATAGIQAQLVDGKLVATLPFTVDREGAMLSRNDRGNAANVRFNRLAIDTLFNTQGAVAQGLSADLPMAPDLERAALRHAGMDQRLPIPDMPPVRADHPTEVRDTLDAVAMTIDLPKVINGAIGEVDLDITSRTTSEHEFPVYDGLGLGIYSVDARIPKGTMRVVVESDGGRIATQAATKPDGSPNDKTAGQPSGFTFDPPMRLVFNPKRGSRWWLQESELEVHGMDIVRSESNPDEIVFKPRFGDAQIGDARLTRNVLALMSKVSESSVNNWLTGMAMSQLTGKSDIPKTTTELAARITEHAGLKLDTQADIIERLLAGMAPEHRDFVRQTLANTELSARVRIRPNERGEPIRFGNNQLTILGGEDIRIARVNGRTELTGMVTLGETRLRSESGSALDMRGTRARLRLVQGADPQHPDVTSLELTDVTTDHLGMRQADGQSYGIEKGQMRRLAFSGDGVVTIEGLSGELTGNMLYNGSQLWLQRSTLTNGSLQLDASGHIRTGPLQLSRVRAAATGVTVTPETNDSAASGVSADIHRLDMDAEVATLAVDPQRGITFSTPANRPAQVAVRADATFVFPSPQMHVRVRNARSSGLLESLNIGPTTKQIALRDWYVVTGDDGEVSGRIVAGPPGSQASDLQIDPFWEDADGTKHRSRLRIFVDRLGFTQQGRDQRVNVTVAGRIDSSFRIPDRDGPPAADARLPASYVRAAGRFNGSVDFSSRSAGRPITPGVSSADLPPELAARAHFELRDGNLTADIGVTGSDAIAGARATGEAIRERWRAPVPPVAPRRK